MCTSLGHLMRACKPVNSAMVSQTETAAQAVRMAGRRSGGGGKSRTESNTPPPRGAGPGAPVLAAADGLLVGQHGDAVGILGAGEVGGDVAGAVHPVEDEDAPAEAARASCQISRGSMRKGL